MVKKTIILSQELFDVVERWPLEQRSQTRGPREGPMRPANI
jgi:hypothetical protein